MLLEAFDSKRVLVTGHTGFKGSWLCEWLLMLGADVTGFSLPPPTEPALFEQLDLKSRVTHDLGDVRNAAALRELVQRLQPEFVFHLAAQSLVRHGYAAPVETFSTNVMGTVNVLEALRVLRTPCVAVIATTDKCYENDDGENSFRETDPLGGKDPYSASKAAAELAVRAYRESFFNGEQRNIFVATARAGNVLGGGDWAPDRILPDCIRALRKGTRIHLRQPNAIRPWQHVLESISGYLVLAARISEAHYFEKTELVSQFTSAFNFGPQTESARTVADLVEHVLRHCPGEWKADASENPPEAKKLQLSIDKAKQLLGWTPVWSFEQTVERALDWYREEERKPAVERLRDYTRNQINDYVRDACASGVAWANE